MESDRAALGNVCALRLFACPSAGGWASAASIECLGTRDVKHGILHEVLHNEELTPPNHCCMICGFIMKRVKI